MAVSISARSLAHLLLRLDVHVVVLHHLVVLPGGLGVDVGGAIDAVRLVTLRAGQGHVPLEAQRAFRVRYVSGSRVVWVFVDVHSNVNVGAEILVECFCWVKLWGGGVSFAVKTLENWSGLQNSPAPRSPYSSASSWAKAAPQRRGWCPDPL